MGKKKDKDKKGRTDAVRAAVDQAFAATAGGAQLTRERAQEIADELAGAVGRLRDALDDARPATAEDLKGLRTELAALGERVARVEAAQAFAAAAPPPRVARSASAARGSSAAQGGAGARAGATRAAAAQTAAAARKTPATPRRAKAAGASTARTASKGADDTAKRASAAADATRARAAGAGTRGTPRRKPASSS